MDDKEAAIRGNLVAMEGRLLALENARDAHDRRIAMNTRVLVKVRDKGQRTAQQVDHINQSWRPMLYGDKDHIGVLGMQRSMREMKWLVRVILAAIIAQFLTSCPGG